MAKATVSIIVSDEQKKAFSADCGYYSHVPSRKVSASSFASGASYCFATGSMSQAWDAVRDYYNSREWN